MASLLGMVTGVGGGRMRDILVADIPNVLRSDLYAVAALAGAVVVVIGQQLDVAPAVTAVLGAVICFGLRLFAIRRGWQLPVAHARADEKSTNVDEANRSNVKQHHPYFEMRSIENGEAYACHFFGHGNPMNALSHNAWTIA